MYGSVAALLTEVSTCMNFTRPDSGRAGANPLRSATCGYTLKQGSALVLVDLEPYSKEPECAADSRASLNFEIVFFQGKMDIPTYQEALQQDGTSKPGSTAMSAMGSQIAGVQNDRIRSAMNTYIRPLLQSQVQAGLSEMIFALVPSDCDPLEGSTSKSSPDILEKTRPSYGDYFAKAPAAEIVSFEGSDYVRVVRLHGPENTVHFWRQPGVIKTLLGEVRLALGLSKEPEPVLPPAPTKNIRDMTKAERREYEQKISVGTLGEGVGWRNTRASQNLQPGEINVSVAIDDLAVRHLTGVGLYETRTGRAIVVTVLVGS